MAAKKKPAAAVVPQVQLYYRAAPIRYRIVELYTREPHYCIQVWEPPRWCRRASWKWVPTRKTYRALPTLAGCREWIEQQEQLDSVAASKADNLFTVVK